MVIPVPLIGLALAGGVALSQSSTGLNKGKEYAATGSTGLKATPKRPMQNRSTPFLKIGRKKSNKPNQRPQKKNIKRPEAPNPFQNLLKGLTTSLGRISQKPQTDDYTAIVKGFLPENAKLLTPRYPANVGNIQFADVDGDSRNEVIASYRLGNEVKTLILKKQNDRWSKVSEIIDQRHDNIHFIGFADIIGEGRKQILIGKASDSGSNILNGYSLHSNGVSEIFHRNYDELEIMERENQNAQLAIWNKNTGRNYDVEILHWNGTQLKALKNIAPYYSRKVLPHYGHKVRQEPQNPLNWYNLAQALDKCEMHRDALGAIEIGMGMQPDESLREDFLVLRKQVQGK